RSAGEEVAGLRAVNVALERLGVVEAADEQHLLAMIGQRLEHLAQLHVLAFAPGPPFLAVKAVAGEEDGETDRRLTAGLARTRLVAPDGQRFEPRQRHRDAKAAKHGAA